MSTYVRGEGSMRVLIWVSKGFVEDIARVSTKDEKNVDHMLVSTDTAFVREKITQGRLDVLMIGASRLSEWRKIWASGVIETSPTFFTIYVSTLPPSDARLMELSEEGIYDVADLTMSRDEIGQRLIDGFKGLRQRTPNNDCLIEKRIDQTVWLRMLSDETDRRILSLIAQGKFDKEISSQLHLSLQTIRNRISRILSEVGARNRTHLALLITESREAPTDDDSVIPHVESQSTSDDQVA